MKATLTIIITRQHIPKYSSIYINMRLCVWERDSGMLPAFRVWVYVIIHFLIELNYLVMCSENPWLHIYNYKIILRSTLLNRLFPSIHLSTTQPLLGYFCVSKITVDFSEVVNIAHKFKITTIDCLLKMVVKSKSKSACKR